MNELSLKRTWTPLVACVAFVGTLALVRSYTYLRPNSQFWVYDIHVHHMNYGILMITLSAALGIYYMGARTTELSSFLFGAGMGLVVDEWGNFLIGSWLFQDYWGLGRDISFTIAAVVGGLLVFVYFLRKHKASEERLATRKVETETGAVVREDSEDYDWFSDLIEDKTRAAMRAVRTVAPWLSSRLEKAGRLPEAGEYHFGAFFLAGDLKRIYREGGLILVEADAVLVENLTDVWQSVQRSMELTGKSFGDFIRGELDQLEAHK